MPQNLLELIALLGADPASYGEKGPDLLAKLVEFEEKSDASRAEKILRDTAEWGEEGRLDPALVAMVIRLVPPAVDLSPDEPFDDVERDNGNGRVPPGLEEESDD